MPTPRSRCLLRSALLVAAVAALAICAAGSGVASQAAAVAPQARGFRQVPPAARSASPAAAGPLDAGQALARARATGHPVTVGTLTTPTSVTTVSPAGKFTTTVSLLRQRRLRNGSWIQLNPSLARAPGGRIVPAATADGVSLSGGGTGPLAELTSEGWTLSLAWPGPLPAAVISGATATYPNVPVAGANLIVTVAIRVRYRPSSRSPPPPRRPARPSPPSPSTPAG